MTLVKICGITNREDLYAAVEVGADMLGFILYEKSKRAVTLAQAAALTAALREMETRRVPLCVGVFVEPAPEFVAETLSACGLQAAQLHITNPAQLVQAILAVNGAAYPAIQPRSWEEASVTLTVMAIGRLENRGLPAAPPWLPELLVDAYHPELRGGTGNVADLALFCRLQAQVRRAMLAGGLTPENVGDVIRQAQPWAVDVASGVEQSPGKKSPGRMREFLQAVRQADAANGRE